MACVHNQLADQTRVVVVVTVVYYSGCCDGGICGDDCGSVRRKMLESEVVVWLLQ